MKKIIFIIILLFNINIFASTSTIVMDIDTGRILYENNAHEKKLIASTTKIMTFVVAYEYAKDFLDVYVEAGDEILKMYGTSIYLSYREKMLLRDLLYGLMLRSGNDAAVVIATFVGGSEEGFVKLMNKKAKALGMNNTIFNNSHGLDENNQNYSTAYDMALLSKYASKIPFYEKVTSTKYYKVVTENKAYSWTNRNKMVFTYPNYVAGKTGYTPSAGRTFVSTAEKDNLKLTIVTLNEHDYYEKHRELYERYFSIYQNYLVVSKENFNKNNNYYLKNDLYYPLKNSEKKDVRTVLRINEDNKEIVLYLNDKELLKEKIYIKEKEIGKIKKNFWTKIRNFFQKIF